MCSLDRTEPRPIGTESKVSTPEPIASFVEVVKGKRSSSHGARKDRDQEDRELHQPAGHVFQAPGRDCHQGRRRHLLQRRQALGLRHTQDHTVQDLGEYQANTGKILWDEKHKAIFSPLVFQYHKQTKFSFSVLREVIAIEEAVQNGQTSLRKKQIDPRRLHKRTV